MEGGFACLGYRYRIIIIRMCTQANNLTRRA